MIVETILGGIFGGHGHSHDAAHDCVKSQDNNSFINTDTENGIVTTAVRQISEDQKSENQFNEAKTQKVSIN